MSEYIASVDIGTTNIKINLFNSDYQVVDMVKYPHLNINQDDTVFEMDFEEIWENVLDGIKHLIIVNEVEQLYMSIEKGTTLLLKKGPPCSSNRSYSSPSCNVFFQ